MPTFKIAHLREQGQNMIVVPLNAEFGRKSESEKDSAISELQLHARGAGLAGTVVPIWQDNSGRTSFIAPQQWHAFFRSLSYRQVVASLNKTLSW